jgi:viroplasmin and RNaseH domain-containing protein
MVETVKPENETLAQACARRQAEKEANSTKFYAVAFPEEHAGVYGSWGECKPHVVGVKGVRFKSFPSEEEAEDYVKNPPPPAVRPSETPEAIAAREAAKIAKEEAKAVKMAEAKAAKEVKMAEAKAAKEAKAQQAREDKEKAKAQAKAAKAAETAKKPLKQLKQLKKRRQAEAAKAAKSPEAPAASEATEAGAEATEAKKTEGQSPKKRRKEATPKVAPESSVQDGEKIEAVADVEQKSVEQVEAEAKEATAAKEAKKQQAKEEKAAKAAEAKAAKAAEAEKKREVEEELEACNRRSRQELLRIAKEEARMEARIAKEVAQAVKMAENMQAKEASEAPAKRRKVNKTEDAFPVEEDPTSPSPLEKQSALESPEKVLSQEAPRLPAAAVTKEVVSKEAAAPPGLTEAQMQRIQENRARALARRSAGC